MKFAWKWLAAAALTAVAFGIVGCTPTPADPNLSATTTQSEAPKADAPKAETTSTEAPKTEGETNTGEKTAGAVPGEGKVAVIKTNQGTIRFTFRGDKAPKTVENFIKLANEKFYDGTEFHRVIPDFMIQGGDPNTKPGATGAPGTGGPGYSIKAEFNDIPHNRGVVSMARSQDPDSAGSQFFIVQKNSNFLDNQYTAFGEVLDGIDVVDKIVKVERGADDRPKQRVRIESIRIEDKK